MPPRRKRVSDDYADDLDDDGDEYEEVKSSKKRGRKSTKGNAAVEATTGTTVKGGGSSLPLLDDGIFSGYQDYSKTLMLKPDHEKRPIWITKNNLIFLEAFSPLYQQACDFLVAIAEPESRPEFIHTYKLTESSLYAAVAVSIDTESIIKVLNRLCKTDVPPEVITFIKQSTETFGKAKIVLKDNCYYIESKFPEVLRELLKNPIIQTSRVVQSAEENESNFIQSIGPAEDKRNMDYSRLTMQAIDANDDEEEADDLMAMTSEQAYRAYQQKFQTVSIMIKQDAVQEVKRSAKEHSHYPLMEEYDFKNDRRNPILNFDLRASTKIRPYQEKSLSKMFGNGRARSGIIVLPCGAGKSLTGVTAASTVKRSCVVMCINNASVKQWKEQFVIWTNIKESSVKCFTSSDKDTLPPPNEGCILISTYSMICHGGRRSAEGQKMIDAIQQREWGLMILDEVHVAPADMFQKVVQLINAHCKLGLTATLVREDNKIQDLGFLVGPKLYEANWIDLTAQGFLARVQCIEVWCPMTKEFYAEYIRQSTTGTSRLQRLLYTLNPRKFRTCEHLVRYHSQRGDKIIIFSDDVPALMLYCEALKPVLVIPYIYGETKESERRDILEAFKKSSLVPCIGLSKVGDTALDIPEANVIIQVSSHFGARRQEAQRLGRILRPKPNLTGGYNAFFYTLISTDTKEMYFSTKRQQYLIDQGYTFKVLQDLPEIADKESEILKSLNQELDLLNKVLYYQCSDLDAKEERALSRTLQGEVEEEEPNGESGGNNASAAANAGGAGSGAVAVSKKVNKGLSKVSGVGNKLYAEK